VGIDKGHGRVERWWWINTSLDLYGRKMTGVGELYLESGELVTFVYSHAKKPLAISRKITETCSTYSTLFYSTLFMPAHSASLTRLSCSEDV
jgi:hypothetical protein